MDCPVCGHANPAGARFCMNCGSPLQAEQPAVREERKVVTVFFADLVGFTGRAEQLDPEDVRAMLSPYYARLRSEIERFGGTVEKFIGDAVMAVFGAPFAHEDDPERAVRAALAVREAVQELNEADPALDLHVRIAVNTGEAVVALDARPSEGEGMVAGDVVNTAARLQSAAPVDGILVGETTYRATERVFEYADHAPVHAKGKSDAIPVWEAVAARARFGIDVSQRGGADLVGRREELDLLLDTLARAARERMPQLLTLVGVPGIGKSRLVWEFGQAVDADPELVVFWRQGRSLPYGEGVAFWAIGEMVKAQAAILDTDSAETAEAKLTETVAELVPDEATASWLATHMRPLVGLAEGDAGGDRRDEAFSAWRRFFEALAERRPLVLVFEDLHWADDNLLDFVDHLVDWATDSPLVVVGTARPELLERRPGWGGGKPNAATVSLSPLSEQEIARLLASLLGQAVMPAETQAPLLARAGGNPLYAEEYARMVQERGVDAGDAALPETVQGIIAARLDALSLEEKALVQDAAVLGKVFWSGALAAMGGVQRWTVEERLHGLERKEFVRRDRRSSVASETEYAFRHVLVRDVAYGQVPRAARAEKHRLAAEWIEALAADREDRAEMLAHHYMSALEYARAAGQDVSRIQERARIAVREAGDRAYVLNALAPAARFYQVALDLTSDDDPERGYLLLRYGKSLFLRDWATDSADILMEAHSLLSESGRIEEAAEAEVSLGTLYWYKAERSRAAPYFERAAARIEGAPPSRAKAEVLTELTRFAMLGEEQEKAIEFGSEARVISEELGLKDVYIRVLNSAGVARVQLGDPDGVSDIEKALELTAPGTPERIRAYINLASTLGELGELDRSFALHREGLAEARRSGSAGTTRWLEGEVMLDEYLSGRWNDALEHIDALLGDRPASHYMDAATQYGRAMIRLARGDDEGALQDSAEALELARSAGDPQILYPALSLRAHVLAVVGLHREAEEVVAELLQHLDRKPASFAAYFLVHLAFVLVPAGRSDELLSVLDRSTMQTRWGDAVRRYVEGDPVGAADAFAEMGAVAEEAYMRLRAAEALVAAGRRPEADAQLQGALAFYSSVGAARYVAEAESLLTASA